MINLDKVQEAIDRGYADSQPILQEALDELIQWRENVEYMLEHQFPNPVRVREGGGHEDLIMSLVVSVEKLKNVRNQTV